MSRYAYTVLFALILAALTASHWKVYHIGRQMQLSEFNAAVAAATERARQREQALVAAKQEVEVKYEQLKKRAASTASGASAELGRLRDDLAAPRGSDQTAPACAGANAAARADRDVLAACATSLVQLAAEADSLSARLVGLQGYVKEVCLKQ